MSLQVHSVEQVLIQCSLSANMNRDFFKGKSSCTSPDPSVWSATPAFIELIFRDSSYKLKLPQLGVKKIVTNLL